MRFLLWPYRLSCTQQTLECSNFTRSSRHGKKLPNQRPARRERDHDSFRTTAPAESSQLESTRLNTRETYVTFNEADFAVDNFSTHTLVAYGRAMSLRTGRNNKGIMQPGGLMRWIDLGTHPLSLVVTQQTFPPHAFKTFTTKGARLPCPPVTMKVCPRVVDALKPASNRGHRQLVACKATPRQA